MPVCCAPRLHKVSPVRPRPSIASVVGLALALASVPVVRAGAQQSRATLTGTVYDPLGAPVEGMLVYIESGPFGSGASTETLTDKAGQYRFERLPPGLYTISPLVDFAPAIEVILEPDQLVRQDIRIHIEEVIGAFSVCVDCAAVPRYTPPESLVREFASDRDAAAKQAVSGAEPAVGWEYYEPDVRVTGAIRERGLIGTVVLVARVETDGAVKDVTVVSSPHAELGAAAAAALQNERWRAAMVRGVPVAVPLRLTIEFVPATRK
jgi:TonB family protein